MFKKRQELLLFIALFCLLEAESDPVDDAFYTIYQQAERHRWVLVRRNNL